MSRFVGLIAKTPPSFIISFQDTLIKEAENISIPLVIIQGAADDLVNHTKASSKRSDCCSPCQLTYRNFFFGRLQKLTYD